jgi:hypothetical protein
MSAHVAPQHCPYCGEEDLRPYADPEQPAPGQAVPGQAVPGHAVPAAPGQAAAGAGHGGWECRCCARVFSVRFIGLAPTVLEVRR